MENITKDKIKRKLILVSLHILNILVKKGGIMNFDERIREVSVIGAAGKMGSGIALLMAEEMTKQKQRPENRNYSYRLNLIDMNVEGLDGLLNYLKTQLLKNAEKSIVMLRHLFKDFPELIDNSDIINYFIEEARSIIHIGTDIKMAKNSKIVFEAIIEDKEKKVLLFKELNSICDKDTFYFTNTSSIPIHILNEEANLDGRIIGFHFYNPPAVQKLVELICADKTLPELKEIALELAKRLNKKIVPSNDIAGFIGNGHFLRDGLYAIKEAKKMEIPLYQAIYAMNKISQDLLLRPMGIFQLIDYVGIDVFHCIAKIMNQYLKEEELFDELLDEMVKRKVLGGQKSDGSQKDGFLKYEKNKPVGVYDILTSSYKDFALNGWSEEIDKKIGGYPEGFFPWKKLLNDPNKEEKLETFFKNLKNLDTWGAKIALSYLKKSKEIGKYLVSSGVAQKEEDVNSVLLNGFYHLYGPINSYIE